jgi:hypothetical protein
VPVLKIDTNPLNIIQTPEHLTLIENRIKQSLGLFPYQPGLPLPEIGAPAESGTLPEQGKTI